jgi:hypothetical protein
VPVSVRRNVSRLPELTIELGSYDNVKSIPGRYTQLLQLLARSANADTTQYTAQEYVPERNL